MAVGNSPGHFINKLDCRSGSKIDVIVTEGRITDAKLWHREIQIPYIASTTRLDRNWDWPKLVFWFNLMERLLGRNTIFFQINAKDHRGNAFPVGQLLLADGYPYFPDIGQPSVFLWYMSATPQNALIAHGLPSDIKLMRALVDTAIQFSFQRGYEGRLLLHAAASGDPSEDNDLFQKYAKAIQLIPYPGGSYIGPARNNDGRYFYSDNARSLALTSQLDYLR